ncbi:MAG: HAD family hydrolase [Leucobacter sp.]
MHTVSPKPYPAAALWDMDGTIIDSEPLWLGAEVVMLERYGIPVPPNIHERLIGQGLTTAARVFQEFGVPLSVDEIIEEWANGVVDGLAKTAPAWIPGALELLASFRELGIPNVLVTMSVRRIADAVLALLPAGTFVASITGDDVEFEKPHPDPYVRGAAALNVQASECIAFEDSIPGTASAVASGAFVIGIPNIVSLDGSDAHRVLPTLVDFDAIRMSALWEQHQSSTKEKS